MNPHEFMAGKLVAQFAPPYQGEIWDNCARFKLVGKGYESMPRDQHGIFKIESARHLAGPLRALRDPEVQVVIIIGATQVMKSVCGDIWIPFCMEHDPRWTLVLFETDPKADQYAATRLMPTIRQHPILAEQIAEVARENRHSVTTTKVTTPGMVLVVGGLNDSNVSTFSWPRIWISEAWQHKSDGLLRKAIKRSDRFPHDRKILIESQAGLLGEDLHTEAMAAHQVPLSWACPFCGGRQTWEFSRMRPDDFKPRNKYEKNKVSKSESDDNGGYEGMGGMVQNLPQPGTYAGMHFDPEETVGEDGKIIKHSIESRARSAQWECYHCAELIPDRTDLRQQIMDSYEQDYQITRPDGTRFSPKAVCFYLPKEAARDNSFEGSAKSFLAAKAAQARGHLLPLQDWYLQERATFYDPSLARTIRQFFREKYDADKTWPDEWRRCLIVDNQQELMHQWASVWSVAKDGRSRQLWRGVLKGLDEVRKKQMEFKVKDQWVFLDGKYKHDDIVSFIFKLGCGHWGSFNGEKEWFCWNLLHGSSRFDFGHRDEGNDRARFPVADAKEDWGKVGDYNACVLTYEFSATQCGDMAVSYRDGRGVETLFLPETDDPGHELSWTAQVNSHHLVKIQSPRHGLSDYVYQPIKQGAPDHFWHILRMFMAVHYIWGIDGVFTKQKQAEVIASGG